MTYGSVQRATQRLKLPMGCVTYGSLCIKMCIKDIVWGVWIGFMWLNRNH
jgi:hypothetical protein